ncbi:MAG: AraC family transcriptional regulator [Gemmatimonadota bacterium]
MAKIAVALEEALARRRLHGEAGRTAPRTIAAGGGEEGGWAVADVVCTCGPQDRAFEERHAHYSIAVVLAGTVQYRSGLGRGLMTPGSVMLGNPGLAYECGHEHAEGDRCVVFWYEPEYFERLAGVGFSVPRLPPLRALAPLVASVSAGVIGASDVAWEELAARVAVRVAGLVGRASSEQRALPSPAPPLNAEARVTRAIRAIGDLPDRDWSLSVLARESRISPYHFLRTFERLTGVTPHQYVLRARLREAATRLVTEPRKIIDVALDSGFGDVSNFNRAFRAEFGVSPRVYQRGTR